MRKEENEGAVLTQARKEFLFRYKFFLVRVGPMNDLADQLHGNLGIVRTLAGCPMGILFLKSHFQCYPGGLDLENMGYLAPEEISKLNDVCGYPKFKYFS